MTALSANELDLNTPPKGATRTYVVKNLQAMYVGGLCGLDANGLLVPWDDTAITQRFLGVFRGFTPALYNGAVVTAGNTSASPALRGIVDCSGVELHGVDVAGVSARASIGEPVYCTTDNVGPGSGVGDLTLTPTAFVKPIGRLIDFRTSSDMDVQLFTPEEYAAYGSFITMSRYITLANIAGAGDVVTNFTPGFRGRVVKWWAEAVVPVTTGSKAATLNIEVGTTDATGGTIALTSATLTPLGAIVAGSAFTAGTAFGATDTLSIEAASVTAFAEGSINLHIVLQADE